MIEALSDAIMAATAGRSGTGGVYATEMPGLAIVRGDRETTLQHIFYDPALIVVVQGSKTLQVGGRRFTYAAGQYLVLGVGMPVLAAITDATPERPYLALAFAIDLRLLSDLLDDMGRVPIADAPPARLGLFVGTLDARQAGTIERLASLLATPEALRVLYPAVAHELLYWTLQGPDGDDIRRLATSDSHTRRIAGAIDVMRAQFAQSVSIERLAAVAHMSPSSFHQHFKALTSLSPLQYQKQLRLLEARRLMLAGGADATRAAYEVGYESLSQFSREYARMFGAPPSRDVATLRAVAS